MNFELSAKSMILFSCILFQLWQRRWIVLRRASSKAPCRLEKFIDEKAARSVTGHKIALLTSVNTICRVPSSVKKHAFTICFMDCSTKCFACDSGLYYL